MSGDAARFRRVEALFLEASKLSPEERGAYLRGACGSDTALLDEVCAMLDHDTDGALGGPNEFRGRLQAVLDQADEGGPGAGIPRRIGRYDVVRRIGLGGMGAVYEAEQAQPQRRVALKVVRPDALSPEVLGRFRHEAELLGRLQHPGIAQIFEAGTFDLGDGEQPFFAMEYVDGLPILEFANERGLTLKQRLSLVAEVCDAVQHAHQQGVIHRDLKSENVLVTGDGVPKILDFGVGRVVDADARGSTSLTAVGQIVGTLAYMSPEQFSGSPGDVDTRSDVYALGVLLYELLTNRLPFDLNRVPIVEAGRIICQDDPPRLGNAPGDVEAIVGKALEKEKARRYASAGDLAGDIRRYLADRPITARPASTWDHIRKFARRHRVAVTGAVATALALSVGVVSTAVQAVRATRHARVATRNEEAARRMAYRANIAAAGSALAVGDAFAARRHLDEAAPDLRNWEWRHLDARLDATEALLRTTSAGPLGQAARIAFRADGTALVASADERALRVIDVVTGEPVATIGLDAAPVALALSPDGARACTVHAERRIRTWDTASGRREADAALDLEGPLVSLHFSDDGSLLEASTAGEVRFLDALTGKERARYRMPQPDYRTCAFNSDGTRLALPLFRHSVRLVDTRSGEPVVERSMPQCGGVMACSPDGTRIAASTDAQTHITLLLHGETLAELGRVGGHPTCAACAAFSPDGRFLATGSAERIVIHDAMTLEKRRSLFLPGIDPRTLRWSPDGSRILVADASHEVRLVRWNAPPFLELVGHESFIYVAAWSPDGTMIASAGWDRTVRLWDALTGAPLAVLPVEEDWVGFVGFARDGTRVFAGGRGSYVAWDVATGQRSAAGGLDHEAMVPLVRGGAKWVRWSAGGQDCATSPDGTLHLTALSGADPSVNRMSETATGAERFVVPARGGRTLAVAIARDNRRFATGGEDGTIRLGDAASGSALTVFRGFEAARVYSIEFSPDGMRLISGGDDARVVLWDLDSGQEVLALKPHESYVHVVAFSPDGTRVLSGSGDATLRIWDSVPRLDRGREIREAEALRRAMQPSVQRLMDELGDPAAVAAALRADETLDPEGRRAALRALLAAR